MGPGVHSDHCLFFLFITFYQLTGWKGLVISFLFYKLHCPDMNLVLMGPKSRVWLSSELARHVWAKYLPYYTRGKTPDRDYFIRPKVPTALWF